MIRWFKSTKSYAMLLVAALIVTLLPAPSANAAYSLVWSDEFNGTSINTNNWTFEIGTGSNGWGNNELQYYTNRPENARIENGNLVIEARQESYGGRNYTSARLKTQGKQTFKYGKIEARIKMPKRPGDLAGILDTWLRYHYGRMAEKRRDRHYGACQ